MKESGKLENDNIIDIARGRKVGFCWRAGAMGMSG